MVIVLTLRTNPKPSCFLYASRQPEWIGYDNNGKVILMTFEQATKQDFPKNPYHIEGRCVLSDFVYMFKGRETLWVPMMTWKKYIQFTYNLRLK